MVVVFYRASTSLKAMLSKVTLRDLKICLRTRSSTKTIALEGWLIDCHLIERCQCR